MFRNYSRLTQLVSMRCAPRLLSRNFGVLAQAPRSIRPLNTNTIRFYSSAPELTPDIVKERLLEILEGYDKVPRNYEIKEQTDFSKDLGLDSLDVVEVVMAIEEEFSIGIPDDKADKIRTFKDALDLIVNDPHAT